MGTSKPRLLLLVRVNVGGQVGDQKSSGLCCTQTERWYDKDKIWLGCVGDYVDMLS